MRTDCCEREWLARCAVHVDWVCAPRRSAWLPCCSAGSVLCTGAFEKEEKGGGLLSSVKNRVDSLAHSVTDKARHGIEEAAKVKDLKKFLDLLPALRGGVKTPEATCSSAGFDNRVSELLD